MVENLFFKASAMLWRSAVLTLLAVCLLSGTVSYGQKVSISQKNMPLADVLKKIREQTGYNFVLANDALEKSVPVTLNVQDAPLQQVLQQVFAAQPLSFAINDKIIIVKPKPAATPPTTAPAPVTGRVTDEGGTPLMGVTVRIQGAAQGAATDAKGAFSLRAEPDAILEFSFIGFETQRQPVNGRTHIDVKLKETASSLNQVVVVGYGTAKKKDLTGSITSIDAGKYNTQAATNLTEYFSGTVAGLSSNQGTSAQGGGSLEIRGVNSLQPGATQPLIVLDGVIYNGSLRDISPSDVATIDVLKDASAAAVYGSRASNGVIIVSTKKGATGLPVINFSATVGYAEPAKNYNPMGPEGYLRFRQDLFDILRPQHDYYYRSPFNLPDSVPLTRWRAFSNNPNPNDTIEWLGRLNLTNTEIQNYLAGNTTDWYNTMMQKGLRENYDLSVSGGAPKINYYFSTGYTRNKGIVAGDEVKMFRTRLNLDARVADFIRVGLNSQFSSTDNSAVPVTGNIAEFSPYGSMYNADGTLKLNPQDDALFRNPFLDNRYKDQFNKTNALFATLFGEITLPWGFSYRISFQNRLANTRNYQFWPANTVNGGISHVNGYGSRDDDNTYEWMVDNILRWNKSFGRHVFDVTLLANAEKLRSWSSTQTNENFQPNGNLSWHGLQFGSNPSLANSDLMQTGDALMARINYSFKDKYLLTASLRRDGFSAFGQQNPRANFPAVALGWRISDEPFFKAQWVDQLKLRASWGVNGNRAVGTYDAISRLDRNVYFDGTNVLTGVTNATMANPGLKWEQTESWNAGLDLSAFKNRVNLTLDVYRSFTNDLLLNRSLPNITGYASMTTNLGQLSNKGIEMNLATHNVHNTKLSWRSTFTLTVNRNKIEKLWGDYETKLINGKEVYREVPDYANGWFPGQSIDRIWTYDIVGIWQQQELAAAKKYGLSPGDFKARDVNGDSIYQQFDDKVFLGYTTPRYQLGLRNDFTILGNIDVMLFFRADLGHYGARNDFNHPSSNVYDRRNALNLPYWSKTSPSGRYPRLNVNNSAYDGGIVPYEPAAFLRLQDVSVAYNFPKTLLAPVKLSALKVFLSARNLFTITKWTGWDPESRNAAMPRIFSAGLNTTL